MDKDGLDREWRPGVPDQQGCWVPVCPCLPTYLPVPGVSPAVTGELGGSVREGVEVSPEEWKKDPEQEEVGQSVEGVP